MKTKIILILLLFIGGLYIYMDFQMGRRDNAIAQLQATKPDTVWCRDTIPHIDTIPVYADSVVYDTVGYPILLCDSFSDNIIGIRTCVRPLEEKFTHYLQYADFTITLKVKDSYNFGDLNITFDPVDLEVLTTVILADYVRPRRPKNWAIVGSMGYVSNPLFGAGLSWRRNSMQAMWDGERFGLEYMRKIWEW